jgi:hypothetical protein
VDKCTVAQEVEIMGFVSKITAAAVGNVNTAWDAERIDKLVRTLYPTMCQLIQKG